jgi:hypothetical protein
MPAVGCIFAIEPIATQSWPVGSKSIGPTALPDKYRYGQLMIDVSAITDMTTDLNFNVEISLDNGVNWVPVGGVGLNFPASGYSRVGGVLVDSGGNPVRVISMAQRFPAPASLVRQIRGTANFSNNASAPQTFGMTLVIW